jgi:hypothetical protein
LDQLKQDRQHVGPSGCAINQGHGGRIVCFVFSFCQE